MKPQRSAANSSEEGETVVATRRLVSLDAYRGFIMLLLAANGFGIASLARKSPDSPVWQIASYDVFNRIGFHFNHPAEWKSNFPFGPEVKPEATAPAQTPPAAQTPATSETATSTEPLPAETPPPAPAAPSPWLYGAVSLWDLIQPAFMFMVGVAMAFSARKRDALDQSPLKQWTHAALRSVILILMGVFLYSLGSRQTNWIFPNVLAQIGLGYFFTYATLRWKWWGQVAAVATILIGTWLAFFMTSAPDDYDFAKVNASAERGEILEPPFRQWSKNGNFAHFADLKLLNAFPRPEDDKGQPIPFEKDSGGYQTLNFVPSIATMILGVICGQILLRPGSPWKHIGILLGVALLCYALGMAAGMWACPIVKRIWTPSWVLFSAAWVIALLALFYALFDALPLKILAFPLVVVGTNSLLIYLMSQLLRGWTADKVIHIHFQKPIEWALGGIANLTGLAAKIPQTDVAPGPALYQMFSSVIDSTAVFLVFWLVLYGLYRKRIFFRV